MHLEAVKEDGARPERDPTPAAATTAAPVATVAPTRLAALPRSVIALQRSAGNRAVAGMVRSLQRCGGVTHEGCACALDGDGEQADAESVAAPVQRAVSGLPPGVPPGPAGTQPGPTPGGPIPLPLTRPEVLAVQRQETKDPADLTGTPFASFDPELQKVLKDKSKFTWTKPTLAETLGDMSNASVAVFARVGAMISASASFLWPFVKHLGGGGWITDNFGLGIQWTDGGALGAALAGDPNYCRDNPATAKWYHGTTSAYRQISSTPGAASLHVITAGKTEVHIDVHQPVEGKEDSWPWKGQCNYDLSAWWDHAQDVTGGGGAKGTAVGRYAVARSDINERRKDSYYRKDEDESRLVEAEQNLDAIVLKVQKYAALGGMVGSEWEGDKQLLADKPTMAQLEHAEELIRKVGWDQFDRHPPETYGP